MHVKLLFVCLVLFGIAAVTHCAGQLRLSVVKIDETIEAGLTTELGTPGNTTVHGIAPLASSSSQLPSYLALPQPLYPFNEYKEFFVYRTDDVSTAQNTNYLNITLEDLQSYTFVFVGDTDSSTWDPVTAGVPNELLVYEERPNPSPTGKALVKVINVAVSSYNTDAIVVSFTGAGVNVANVSLNYREASQFIEFPANVNVNLTTTFINGDQLTVPFVPVADATVLIYLRGDISAGLGHFYETYAVNFAFPAAPQAEPPTSEPVAGPVSQPVAVPVQPTGTTPRPRTPAASSAAKSVAQGSIIGALLLGYLYL